MTGSVRKWIAGLVLLVLNGACLAAADDWRLDKTDASHQIRIYTRAVPGSPLREFRGVMRVQTSLTALVALIEDTRSAAQWVHQCRALEIIERFSPDEMLLYMVNALPWPLQDRDSIVHSRLTQHPDSGEVTIAMSVRNDVFPLSDDMVRVTQMQGRWHFLPQPQGWVEVVYQVHADPGGSLPDWLVNSVVVDVPYHTLRNMQQRVLQPEYQQARLPHVRDVRLP